MLTRISGRQPRRLWGRVVIGQLMQTLVSDWSVHIWGGWAAGGMGGCGGALDVRVECRRRFMDRPRWASLEFRGRRVVVRACNGWRCLAAAAARAVWPVEGIKASTKYGVMSAKISGKRCPRHQAWATEGTEQTGRTEVVWRHAGSVMLGGLMQWSHMHDPIHGSCMLYPYHTVLYLIVHTVRCPARTRAGSAPAWKS